MAVQNFWENREEAQQVVQKITLLKGKIQAYIALQEEFTSIDELWQLAVSEDEEELETDIQKGLVQIEQGLENLELAVLFSDRYDANDAIVTLHAGAGGVDAMDWTEMLYRMYVRWAERKGYKVETYDMWVADEAGLKSVTFAVEGENAFGYLKSEIGVHRLIRMSPFDTMGKRHTSFASVEVLPQLEDEQEIQIDEQDLRIDTFRAQGKGGQHLNKTDSAVRITHMPSGIVVSCQNERSQHANKRSALKVLQAKLLVLQKGEQELELEELRGDQQEISWGSQIRSYTFNPYQMVKDHRTGEEAGNITAVMDGEIDNFITAYLKELARRKH